MVQPRIRCTEVVVHVFGDVSSGCAELRSFGAESHVKSRQIANISINRQHGHSLIHGDAPRCERLGGKWRDLFLVSAVASLPSIDSII